MPISFKPLTLADLPLLSAWFSEPHVDEWWHASSDMRDLVAKYAPRIEGKEPTFVFIIRDKENPIGFIQWYHWSDYPAHASQLRAPPNSAGLDLALGSLQDIGKGLGPLCIAQFIRETIFADPTITSVVVDPETRNHRSIRAFEKLGFRILHEVTLAGEHSPRSIMQLDRHPA